MTEYINLIISSTYALSNVQRKMNHKLKHSKLFDVRIVFYD